MARIQVIKPKLKAMDTRTCPPRPKQVDAALTTEAHRTWRGQVLQRAGFACEKCGASGSTTRLFADHIKERRDGGALLDPANGQCLCGACHSKKTAAERARRMADRHTFTD
jgi:5-methylcytosine-specific restriction protein A